MLPDWASPRMFPEPRSRKILHGDLKSRSEIIHLQNDPQTFARGFRQMVQMGHDEVGVRLPFGSAHPTPELVELSKAEKVGLVDDDGVGPGKIQAGFDDGRADQDIQFTVPETVHGVFQARSAIWPCAIPTLASGANSWTKRMVFSNP